MALTQTHFRFRTDGNAVDATPTWGADEDASPNPATTPLRLRLGVQSTAAATGEFEIYAQKNAGSYAAITTSATGGIQSYDASSDADNTILRVPRLSLTADWQLVGAAIDLDFAGNRIYPSGAFTDYLSCSRASIGYAKNSDGTLTQFSSNTLRIGAGLGLLIEDAGTNDSPESQIMTGYGTNLSITDDNTTAPDGTTTAALLVTTAVTNNHFVTKVASMTGFSAGSVYVKAAGYNYASVGVVDIGVGWYVMVVDLTSGSITATNTTGTFTLVSTVVEPLADGWWRIGVVLADTSSNDKQLSFGPSDVASPGFFSAGPYYLGDGTSGIYAWGAQVENNGFITSYMPTATASPATRAADVITTGGSLQTDIAAATGSIVVQVNNGESINFAANIVDSNGTNLLGFDATNHGLASITASLATGNTGNRTTRDKLGIAWDGSGRSLVLNGGTVATDASAQTPNSTQHVGSSGTANFAFAYVERLTAWTSKIAGATLQGHTN